MYWKDCRLVGGMRREKVVVFGHHFVVREFDDSNHRHIRWFDLSNMETDYYRRRKSFELDSGTER